MVSAQELHLDWENIWLLYNLTFSLFFFLLDFVKKTFVFITNPYFRRVSCWWNAHLCANAIICIVPGTFFSRRWLWGGLKCVTVVKLTFSKTFSFFHLFKHPLFRAANLSKMMLSLVRGATFRSLMPILGPLWGRCPRAFLWAKPLFYLRKFMFFLKNINFT